MGNIGRFACVALPFGLTLASLIAMLVGGLAGVTDKSLYMFQVNATNLTINSGDVASLLSRRTEEAQALTNFPRQSANVTGENLGLYALYNIGLWNYCYTSFQGTTGCTKPQFNWAKDVLNTTNNGRNLLSQSGYNVTLSDTIIDAVNKFVTVTKWTEVVFIIAYITLGIALFLGIFTTCSRVFSCCTFLVAGVAVVAVCAAASLATAMSVVVVGTLEASVKWYGVSSSFNTRFLATVWVGAAFALAAGFFWLFTICCCAPDHRSRKRGGVSRHVDPVEPEKPLMSVAGNSGYAPLHDGSQNSFASQHQQTQLGHKVGGASGDRKQTTAYEPYSHAHV